MDPYTGFTTLRVGKNTRDAAIVDGALHEAILTGPTNLKYAQDAVYFTDRNPTYNTGLLRVWNLTSQTVSTIAGQSQRSSADGNTASAGVGAAWGVDVNELQGWVAWTEASPNTNAVRVSTKMPDGTMTARTPCQNGFYYNTQHGGCMECTNSKPSNTVFVTQGSIDQPESCSWKCPWETYLPYTCPEFKDVRTRNRALFSMAVSAVGGSPVSQVSSHRALSVLLEAAWSDDVSEAGHRVQPRLAADRGRTELPDVPGWLLL